jgi:cystathionine gamma-synthase
MLLKLETPSKPTYTPKSYSHGGLKEPGSELVHRTAIDPSNVRYESKDVFLYPTGIDTVSYATNLIQRHCTSTVVVLGVVFHNTFHYLLKENPNGFKYVWKVDKEGIDGMETWLEEEKKARRTVSFATLKFPESQGIQPLIQWIFPALRAYKFIRLYAPSSVYD